MGGRRTYSIDNIVGISSSAREAKKKLVKSVKSKSVKEIIPTTIELFTRSDEALNNFVKVVDTFDFVKESIEKRPVSYKERKKIASNYWTERKKQKDISVPSEIDRIFVSSLTKILRGREKK